MAQLGNFNPDAVQDEQREPIPAGHYIAQIIESDLVALKSGKGQMLKLTFEVVDGPCTKRRVYENLNILHENAQAQDIAQRSLKRICAAVGHQGVLNDSEALHFKPMRIRVSVEEDASGKYGPQNRVKNFEPAQGGAPAPQGQSQPSYSSPSQQNGGGYAQASAGGGGSPLAPLT